MNKKSEDINIYGIYLKDIRKYGTIDDAKTREYLKTYHNGTIKEKNLAKERIVGAHQRFVCSIANKFSQNGNLMDLISEGNIGLMLAIDKYDVNSEVKFTTYATYWIRKTIMGYITVEEPMVTLNNAIKLATYLPKFRQEFWFKNQRYPTAEEIQDGLKKKHNLNFANKEDLIAFEAMSIDEKYGKDENGQEFMETNDYTSKTATCDTDEIVRKEDAKITVRKILSKLSDREAYIIKCVYGIDGASKSMNDVANEVGISYERVRQIAVNGVKRLGSTYKNLIDTF